MKSPSETLSESVGVRLIPSCAYLDSSSISDPAYGFVVERHLVVALFLPGYLEVSCRMGRAGLSSEIVGACLF